MSHTKPLAAASAALALVLTAAAPALAAKPESHAAGHQDQRTTVFRSELRSLNNSGAQGVAKLRLKGNVLSVRIDARGLVPNLVHAQHIHGVGNSECPTQAAAGPDGILSTADGLPFYGPIAVSLTESGSTAPSAGLDITIMPVADQNGAIRYQRTFELPADVASNLAAFQIVQHGVDFNANGAYDFGAGASELDGALPQEATAPADCGTIEPIGHNHHR